MTRKKTTKKFKKEVQEKLGNDYVVLGKYKGNGIPIKMWHKRCSHYWFPRPNNLISGATCAYCNGSLRKTTHWFKQQVRKQVGDEYLVCGSYKKKTEKLLMCHQHCYDGNTYYYWVAPDKFLLGERCPRCRYYRVKSKTRKEPQKFAEEVQDLTGDEYIFLTPYINSSTYIYYYHRDCGKVSKIVPNSFLRGTRCIYCYGNPTLTNQEFKKRVNKLSYGQIYVDDKSTYVNTFTLVKLHCKNCNRYWYVTPSNFYDNPRCKYCNSLTSGERAIKYYLEKHEIEHIIPYAIKIENERVPYRLDFYLPKLKVAIEYNGLQHYKPIDYFGGIRQYKKQIEHDKKKGEWCKNHNVKLLIIPYTQNTYKKIKNTLDNFFKYDV